MEEIIELVKKAGLSTITSGFSAYCSVEREDVQELLSELLKAAERGAKVYFGIDEVGLYDSTPLPYLGKFLDKENYQARYQTAQQMVEKLGKFPDCLFELRPSKLFAGTNHMKYFVVQSEKESVVYIGGVNLHNDHLSGKFRTLC